MIVFDEELPAFSDKAKIYLEVVLRLRDKRLMSKLVKVKQNIKLERERERTNHAWRQQYN